MTEFLVLVGLPALIAAVLWALCRTLDIAIGYGRHSDAGIFSGYAATVMTVVAVVMLIWWAFAAANTRGTVNDMVAFYESNQQNYQYAIESTEDVNIVRREAGLVDVAYLEQGKLTGQRIQELRDRVNWYNETLQNYQEMNTSWFLGAFYHNPPDFLKPIVLLEE